MFMRNHISLEGGGMGGVSFRESRSGLKLLMDSHGYDYETYKTFIDNYENALVIQYNDSMKKEEGV